MTTHSQHPPSVPRSQACVSGVWHHSPSDPTRLTLAPDHTTSDHTTSGRPTAMLAGGGHTTARRGSPPLGRPSGPSDPSPPMTAPGEDLVRGPPPCRWAVHPHRPLTRTRLLGADRVYCAVCHLRPMRLRRPRCHRRPSRLRRPQHHHSQGAYTPSACAAPPAPPVGPDTVHSLILSDSVHFGLSASLAASGPRR